MDLSTYLRSLKHFAWLLVLVPGAVAIATAVWTVANTPTMHRGTVSVQLPVQTGALAEADELSDNFNYAIHAPQVTRFVTAQTGVTKSAQKAHLTSARVGTSGTYETVSYSAKHLAQARSVPPVAASAALTYLFQPRITAAQNLRRSLTTRAQALIARQQTLSNAPTSSQPPASGTTTTTQPPASGTTSSGQPPASGTTSTSTPPASATPNPNQATKGSPKYDAISARIRRLLTQESAAATTVQSLTAQLSAAKSTAQSSVADLTRTSNTKPTIQRAIANAAGALVLLLLLLAAFELVNSRRHTAPAPTRDGRRRDGRRRDAPPAPPAPAAQAAPRVVQPVAPAPDVPSYDDIVHALPNARRGGARNNISGDQRRHRTRRIPSVDPDGNATRTLRGPTKRP